MAGMLRTTVPNSGKIRCSLLGFTDLEAIFEHLDDLGNAERTDEHRYHLDAAVQFGEAKGKPWIELQQITAHAGQKQPDKTGNPAFDHQVRAGQGAADQNTEEGQQKKLEGGKLQGKMRNDRGICSPRRAC